MRYVNGKQVVCIISRRFERRLSSWLAHSPDLSFMEFFYWSTLRKIILLANQPAEERPTTLEDLLASVRSSIEEIDRVQGMINRAIMATRRRAARCLEVQGGHFERFL